MSPALLIITAIFGTWLTLPCRTAYIRRVIPQACLFDEIISCTSTLVYLAAAITFTAEAHRVCEWVNRQHAENVYNAGLGTGFFTMLWLMFFFAVVILAAPPLALRFKQGQSRGSATEVDAHHSDQAVVTSHVRLKTLDGI
jgi:hypothetical protein